jgi:hypothetical protein
MAAFDKETEKIFDQLHTARREIEAAASTLISEQTFLDSNSPYYDKEEVEKCRLTLFGPRVRGTPDPVGEKLEDFQKRMERLCRPLIDRRYKTSTKHWWQFWQ